MLVMVNLLQLMYSSIKYVVPRIIFWKFDLELKVNILVQKLKKNGQIEMRA